MADFSGPKYASYVQLCRELKLKRPLHEMPPPFDSYQEFAGWDQLEAGGMVYSYGLAQDFNASVIHEDADPIWLPTLADWLEMLLEPLVPWLVDPEVLRPVKVLQFVVHWMTRHVGYPYEEACARIYQEITQRAIAP